MDAGKLTVEQRERLTQAVAARRDYLTRVRQRMNAVGWDKACPVYNAARAAELALGELLSAIRASRPDRLSETEGLSLAGEIIRGLVKRR